MSHARPPLPRPLHPHNGTTTRLASRRPGLCTVCQSHVCRAPLAARSPVGRRSPPAARQVALADAARLDGVTGGTDDDDDDDDGDYHVPPDGPAQPAPVHRTRSRSQGQKAPAEGVAVEGDREPRCTGAMILCCPMSPPVQTVIIIIGSVESPSSFVLS